GATEPTTTTAVGANQVEAAGAGMAGPPRAWRTWAAVGRLTGSRSRHAAARGRKDSGTPLRTRPTLSARNSTEEGCPSPKGPVPVRAETRTAPEANSSTGGPRCRPRRVAGAV